MRRRIITIGIFLLGGAVVNVAVAWGCAIWAPLAAPGRIGSLSDGLDRWELARWDGLGATRVEWKGFLISPGTGEGADGEVHLNHTRITLLRDTGIFWYVSYEFDSDLSPPWGTMRKRSLAEWADAFDTPAPPSEFRTATRTFEDARGWPNLAIWGGFSIENRNGSAVPKAGERTLVTWGIAQGPAVGPAEGVRTLSFGLIWPGFLRNTIFYATLLWLLIVMPSAWRRTIRTRRGLCPKCAYPAGASDLCCECGEPLPRRTVT